MINVRFRTSWMNTENGVGWGANNRINRIDGEVIRIEIADVVTRD